MKRLIGILTIIFVATLQLTCTALEKNENVENNEKIEHGIFVWDKNDNFIEIKKGTRVCLQNVKE